MGLSSDYTRKTLPVRSILKFTCAGLIRCYQVVIAPIFPPSCRFNPSCSEYTREAVVKYGALKGSWMGIKRIIRCNPFRNGGYDPIP